MLHGFLFEGFISSAGNITHTKQLAAHVDTWMDLLHDRHLGIFQEICGLILILGQNMHNEGFYSNVSKWGLQLVCRYFAFIRKRFNFYMAVGYCWIEVACFSSLAMSFHYQDCTSHIMSSDCARCVGSVTWHLVSKYISSMHFPEVMEMVRIQSRICGVPSLGGINRILSRHQFMHIHSCIQFEQVQWFSCWVTLVYKMWVSWGF